MPYNSNTELPDEVQRDLPDHAQEIYRGVFNRAWEEYTYMAWHTREQVSNRIAWEAVKHFYERDSHSGRWKRRPRR